MYNVLNSEFTRTSKCSQNLAVSHPVWIVAQSHISFDVHRKTFRSGVILYLFFRSHFAYLFFYSHLDMVTNSFVAVLICLLTLSSQYLVSKIQTAALKFLCLCSCFNFESIRIVCYVNLCLDYLI